jgi:PAS domain S-box-containing protein
MAANRHNLSCGHLDWIFSQGALHRVPLEKIISTSTYSREHLQNPELTISWLEFSDLISNASMFFEDTELRDIGRDTWLSESLLAHASIGRILFSPKDQFMAIYGPAGYLSRNFPVETSIEQPIGGRLVIKIKMAEGARPCNPFFTIVAGQMEALTQSLGFDLASVTVKSIERGASYIVEHPEQLSISTALSRTWNWFTSSRTVTGQFAYLLETHEHLKHSYAQALDDRKKSLLELQNIEESYRLIGSNVTDAIWTLTKYKRFSYCSPSVARILGYGEDELIDTEFSRLIHPDHLDAFSDLFDRIFQNLTPTKNASIELSTRHREGHYILLSINAVFSNIYSGQSTVVCVARDISHEKKLEKEIHQRSNNFRVITDSAPDAIITFDETDRITYANPVASEIFGFPVSQLRDMSIKELVPEALGDAQLREVFRSLSSKAAHGITMYGLHRDKTLIPLESSFSSYELNGKIYKTCIARDVSASRIIETERQELKQQLQASQKLDSIGQLSGEIAHDFNNLLVAILGYTDLALQKGDTDNLDRYLNEIKKAGERGTDMTEKLLSFSRRQKHKPTAIEANKLLQGVADMISRLLPSNIEVIIDEQLNGEYLMADRTQLEQVIVNLSVNARDAMPGGGTLTLGSRRSDTNIVFTVSDTGSGMDDEVRQHIFKPFFTTKPEGSGTGLGLSVVFGIINQHEGHVEVDSILGQGTSFHLYLPQSDQPAASDTVQGNQNAMQGQETILLVEDNDQVRELARLILIGAGYHIIEACDGQEAVATFKQHAPQINLVVMDVVMPKLSGRDAAQLMLTEQPDTLIAYTTGYSDTSVHARFIHEEGHFLIAKPYGTKILRDQVRQILDSCAGSEQKHKAI